MHSKQSLDNLKRDAAPTAKPPPTPAINAGTKPPPQKGVFPPLKKKNNAFSAQSEFPSKEDDKGVHLPDKFSIIKSKTTDPDGKCDVIQDRVSSTQMKFNLPPLPNVRSSLHVQNSGRISKRLCMVRQGLSARDDRSALPDIIQLNEFFDNFEVHLLQNFQNASKCHAIPVPDIQLEAREPLPPKFQENTGNLPFVIAATKIISTPSKQIHYLSSSLGLKYTLQGLVPLKPLAGDTAEKSQSTDSYTTTNPNPTGTSATPNRTDIDQPSNTPAMNEIKGKTIRGGSQNNPPPSTSTGSLKSGTECSIQYSLLPPPVSVPYDSSSVPSLLNTSQYDAAFKPFDPQTRAAFRNGWQSPNLLKVDLFGLLQSYFTPKPMIDLSHLNQPLHDYVAENRIVIRIKSLSWPNVGYEDVIFCSFALYDIEQKIKLTETFHFDFLDELENKSLASFPSSCFCKVRRALVSLSYRSSSIYILFKLKTIFKGDIDDVTSAYLESVTVAPKDRTRLGELTKQAAKLLHPFTQNFAWGTTQIFNDRNQLLLHDDTRIKLYRMKPSLDLATFFDIANSPEKIKVYRTLDGTISLSAFLYTPEKYKLQYVLDVNNNRYPDYDLRSNVPPIIVGSRTTISGTVQEIKEFIQPFHTPHPKISYENNLYINIMNINCITSKVKAKNLAVRIWLMETEGSPTIVATESVYNMNGFSKCYTTVAEFGERSTVVLDEVKIKLPLILTEKHHILFQILNVNHKVLNPKKKTTCNPHELLGTCFIQLFKDKIFLSDNTYTLKVQPPPLAGVQADKLYLGELPTNFIDDEKFTVTFHSHLSSSVYTVDENLAKFYLNRTGSEFIKALDTIQNTPDSTLMTNSVSILELILSSLLSGNPCDESFFGHTFCTMIEVALKIFNMSKVKIDSNGLIVSDFLYSYNKYHFGTTPYPVDPAEVISEGWVYLLNISTKLNKQQAATSNIFILTLATVFELSWWILDSIMRSMELKVLNSNEVSSDDNRSARFSDKLKNNLILLVTHFPTYALEDHRFTVSNLSMAKFCCNLLRIMDRGFVFSLIYIYTKKLAIEPETCNFALEFIQTVCEYEHYIPLNLPGKIIINNPSYIYKPFSKSSFLTVLYSEVIKLAIQFYKVSQSGSEVIYLGHIPSIVTLRNLIWKHSLDARYQSIEVRKDVAGIYFPFIIQMITSGYIAHLYKASDRSSNASRNVTATSAATDRSSPMFEDIFSGPLQEIYLWCSTIFWVLRHCDQINHYISWKQIETPSNLMLFLDFLRIGNIIYSSSSQLSQNYLAALTALLLDEFVDGNESQMMIQSSGLYESFSQNVIHILRLQKATYGILAFLKVIQNFISTISKPLFSYPENNLICNELCCEVLKLCYNHPPEIVSAAKSILLLMIYKNYQNEGTFTCMKLYTTIAINKLARSIDSNPNDTFPALDEIAVYKNPDYNPEFLKQLQDLFHRYSLVFRNTRKASSISSKFSDTKLEYFYMISNEYVDCPELRVTCLFEMSKLNEKTDNFEEAAICRVMVASLISAYLLTVNPSNYSCLDHFQASLSKVAPAIKLELPLSLSWYQGAQILSTDFTEEGLITTLSSVINLFIKCENFEMACQVLLLASEFAIETRRYSYVGQYGTQLSECATRAHQSNRMQSRIPFNYYRVGFYGKGFGDGNCKEYIYRVSPTKRLADFTTEIKKRYEIVIGADSIDILNNKPIAQQSLDPEKHYMQIVSLEIYFDVTDLRDREITYLDRNANIIRFYYETAYAPDGGRPVEDVDQMCKRKEIVSGKFPMPCMFQRVDIVNKEIKILTPIETAIDFLVNIGFKLRQALNCTPPNTKVLQILLQGAILTQVNAGPAAIISKFLGEADKYPPDLVGLLKDLVKAFMRACQFGLRLNGKLIEKQPKLEALHNAMMEAFANLQAEVEKYMSLT